MAWGEAERRKALSSHRFAFVTGSTKFSINLCSILHPTEDTLSTTLRARNNVTSHERKISRLKKIYIFTSLGIAVVL